MNKYILLIFGVITAIVIMGGVSIYLYFSGVKEDAQKIANNMEDAINEFDGREDLNKPIDVEGITVPLYVAKDVYLNKDSNPKCIVIEDSEGNLNEEAVKVCEEINKQ